MKNNVRIATFGDLVSRSSWNVRPNAFADGASVASVTWFAEMVKLEGL